MEVQLGLLANGTEFTYCSMKYKNNNGPQWIIGAAKRNKENILGPQDNDSDTIIKCSPYLGGKYQDNNFVQVWFNTKTIVTVS